MNMSSRTCNAEDAAANEDALIDTTSGSQTKDTDEILTHSDGQCFGP